MTEIPYLTDGGNPIHTVPEGVRNGYLQELTGEQSQQLLQHANHLGQIIHGFRAERTECKTKARELMRVPAGAPPEERTERTKKLRDVKAYFDKLAEHIDLLKQTTYTVDPDKGLVVPRNPKRPAKPEGI